MIPSKPVTGHRPLDSELYNFFYISTLTPPTMTQDGFLCLELGVFSPEGKAKTGQSWLCPDSSDLGSKKTLKALVN